MKPYRLSTPKTSPMRWQPCQEAGAVAEAMGTTTTAMAAEVVEGEDVGAVGVEVEDGLRVTAVGEGGEVGGVQEEAVEGEVVAVLTLL